MTTPINPFAQLLGLLPGRLPKTAHALVVMDGKPLTNLRQIRAAVGDDAERSAELRQAVKQARKSTRYQAERADPEAMAARQAHQARQARQDDAGEAHREYMRRYRAEHRDRIRELKRNWARAQYLLDPSAAAADQREQYHANPEHARALARARYQRNKAVILPRIKARRAAALEAAQATATAAAAANNACPFPTPERTTP